MNIQEILNMLLLCSFAYPTIKIFRIYKKLKKGETEKHLKLKIICYTLFYEPFIVYDIVKWGFKKLNRNAVFGDMKQ